MLFSWICFRNLVCPISSIFELIKMGIKEQVKASGEYRCPYNIRFVNGNG